MNAIANKDIKDLEERFKRLRIVYEKYFAGIERLEPANERARFKRMLRELRAQPTANTARKFRLQQLQATFTTHETHWNRICKRIEEGTYKRDVLRAKRRQQAMAPAAQETRRTDTQFPDVLRNLHSAYNQGRDGSQVSIESFAKTIAKQTEAIKSKYGCDTVEFKVAVKEGKTILKAIPR